jgi:hypothetical protein
LHASNSLNPELKKHPTLTKSKWVYVIHVVITLALKLTSIPKETSKQSKQSSKQERRNNHRPNK